MFIINFRKLTSLALAFVFVKIPVKSTPPSRIFKSVYLSMPTRAVLKKLTAFGQTQLLFDDINRIYSTMINQLSPESLNKLYKFGFNFSCNLEKILPKDLMLGCNEDPDFSLCKPFYNYEYDYPSNLYFVLIHLLKFVISLMNFNKAFSESYPDNRTFLFALQKDAIERLRTLGVSYITRYTSIFGLTLFPVFERSGIPDKLSFYETPSYQIWTTNMRIAFEFDILCQLIQRNYGVKI